MFSKVFLYRIKKTFNFFFLAKIENRNETLVNIENNTKHLPYNLHQILSQLKTGNSTLNSKLLSPLKKFKIVFFWMEIVLFIQGYIKKRQF